MEWTNDLVVKLIKEYEARPVLWDPSHNLFRIISAKNEAWEEMSTEFDIEISDLKKKVQSVLASHRRENARVKARGKSFWFLYQHMRFLPNHVDVSDDGAAEAEYDTQQDNTLEDDEDHMVTEYLEIPSEELAEHVIIKEEANLPKKKIVYNAVQVPLPRTKNKANRVFKRPQKVLKSKILYNDFNDSSITNHENEANKTDYVKKKDECDSFGEYIATSLRKHDQRTRSMIKHAINNILFEQEMKKYSPGMQYTLVADDGENPLILGDDTENHEDL